MTNVNDNNVYEKWYENNEMIMWEKANNSNENDSRNNMKNGYDRLIMKMKMTIQYNEGKAYMKKEMKYMIIIYENIN